MKSIKKYQKQHYPPIKHYFYRTKVYKHKKVLHSLEKKP